MRFSRDEAHILSNKLVSSDDLSLGALSCEYSLLI